MKNYQVSNGFIGGSLGIAIQDTDLGRNSTVFQGIKKEVEFINTKKKGGRLPKVSCFERTVIGTNKQTYTVLQVTDYLSLLLGEVFITFNRKFSDAELVPGTVSGCSHL